MIALFTLYGAFFAIDESQSRAFIADLEPERRATAVGAYNFFTAELYLPASLVAWSPVDYWCSLGLWLGDFADSLGHCSVLLDATCLRRLAVDAHTLTRTKGH